MAWREKEREWWWIRIHISSHPRLMTSTWRGSSEGALVYQLPCGNLDNASHFHPTSSHLNSEPGSKPLRCQTWQRQTTNNFWRFGFQFWAINFGHNNDDSIIFSLALGLVAKDQMVGWPCWGLCLHLSSNLESIVLFTKESAAKDVFGDTFGWQSHLLPLFLSPFGQERMDGWAWKLLETSFRIKTKRRKFFFLSISCLI